MTLESKISSIRDALKSDYVRPSNDKVNAFCNALSNNPNALDYLLVKRGLSNSTILNFKLGYCEEKNAISIPIYKRGELVNIKYRLLDENSKIKYTQEKGCEVWLFNEDGIQKGQKKGGVLIVEGEFDCMSAWQAGFTNVISPASGKDSYGIWLELLDTIPKVYISYDNDKPGKSTAMSLAERIGTEKCWEVLYPDGIKDANEFFNEHTKDDYRKLIIDARPFYKYKYAGVKDVIDSIREKKEQTLTLDCIPYVEWEEDWLGILSGVSNIGKTSVALNIANELVEKDIPTLVLPIERGIRSVGKRYLQVRYNKTKDELENTTDDEWNKIIPDVVGLPLYFSVPKIHEVEETVIKAKRLFNTKFVIIDHLDLLVRKSDAKNINVETSSAIQNFKQIAQEHGITFIIVHHIKKQEGLGSVPKKPKMEDLKGSSATYQDPEVVIMLSQPDKGQIEIDILKNKGPMGSKIYDFNVSTGKIGVDITDTDAVKTPSQIALDNF